MTTYKIVSNEGVTMSIYEAETVSGALDAMAQDAGYDSQADAVAQGIAPFTGTVTEMPTVTRFAASRARATDTGVERGIDVDVVLTLSDGRTLDGEVTLVPSLGDGALRSYGPSPHYWMSGGLLETLQQLGLDDRGTLREIEATAAAVVANVVQS